MGERGRVEVHLEFMMAARRSAISLPRHLCARHRDESKDLVWLDPCDEHRDEEIKQAAARIPDLNRPQSISRKSV
ncbi:hypothetical protein DA101_032205 [Sinorhizobium meliloti]|nr:hypothetical protein DA101_032205 [Sinorhizobium meliloti]